MEPVQRHVHIAQAPEVKSLNTADHWKATVRVATRKGGACVPCRMFLSAGCSSEWEHGNCLVISICLRGQSAAQPQVRARPWRLRGVPTTPVRGRIRRSRFKAADVHQEPLEYSPRARGPNPPPIGIHRVARLPLPPQRRRCHHQCAAFTALVRTRLLASVKSTPPPTSTASTHSTSADHHVSISRESSVFAATAGAEGGSSSPTPA